MRKEVCQNPEPRVLPSTEVVKEPPLLWPQLHTQAHTHTLFFKSRGYPMYIDLFGISKTPGLMERLHFAFSL